MRICNDGTQRQCNCRNKCVPKCNLGKREEVTHRNIPSGERTRLACSLWRLAKDPSPSRSALIKKEWLPPVERNFWASRPKQQPGRLRSPEKTLSRVPQNSLCQPKLANGLPLCASFVGSGIVGGGKLVLFVPKLHLESSKMKWSIHLFFLSIDKCQCPRSCATFDVPASYNLRLCNDGTQRQCNCRNKCVPKRNLGTRGKFIVFLIKPILVTVLRNF